MSQSLHRQWRSATPITRAVTEPKIATNLKKLAPRMFNIPEAALAPMPSFVIQRPEPVAHAIGKSNLANVIFVVIGELECVHPESQEQVITSPFGTGIWAIRFGIPSSIELMK
ncbi:hypothetical protein OVA24_15455 [Luteolibacter sp. SL250]|uniref:hypothetical protein n=1 Tax=Luteolibacter sp. SL250 TaxID=2995170 RepID=UPI0022717A2F|nr:hypothetical protein [Luteolibacter sp. SL250]WAC18628.1 hypothetical protein OVA24_15455 [Luteolibacter sp. SL250]